MDSLTATFTALADPTRRAILGRLAQGGATVGELAEPFAISAPAISRHLKVLEQAKLIRREVEAQKRRCHSPKRSSTLRNGWRPIGGSGPNASTIWRPIWPRSRLGARVKGGAKQ